MSAYNIELPGVVLAGLYKKAIVQGEGKAVTEGGRTTAAEEKTPAAASPLPTATPRPEAVTTPVVDPVPAAATTPVQPATQPVAATPSVDAGKPPKEQPSASLDAGQAERQAPPAAGQAYKILGNNRQQVTVVVRCPGEAFLPEHHLQLLTKMLGACKLNLGDVAIVNDAAQQVDISILKDQLHPRRVLLFGVTPEEAGLPLSFPAFKDQEYAGTTYLHTPSLDELNVESDDGKLLKRRLWDSLKKIFGV